MVNFLKFCFVCPMAPNRIQKLLFTEYKDFEDMVLVESPFALTTRDGRGIRQVQMGLTPTKLILATDVIEEAPVLEPSKDPEINNFELISLSPIEYVNISVFRRRSRNTLKAHFCNNRVLYLELAAPQKRDVFWNLWCERVKFLSPEEPNSTESETSVGSTTSISSTQFEGQIGNPMTTTNQIPNFLKLVDRKKSNMGLLVNDPHNLEKRVETSRRKKKSRRGGGTLPTPLLNKTSKSALHVNRFREGVSENCFSALYLPTNFRFAQHNLDELRFTGCSSNESDSSILDLIEEGVEVWETNRKPNRHRRRYAIIPSPNYLHGFGLEEVSPSQSTNFKLRGYSSETCLRGRPGEPEFDLEVPKVLLKSSLSEEKLFTGTSNRRIRRLWQPTSPILIFWTPGFSYSPMTEQMVYKKKISLMKNFMRRRNDKAITKNGLPYRSPMPDFLEGGDTIQAS